MKGPGDFGLGLGPINFLLGGKPATRSAPATVGVMPPRRPGTTSDRVVMMGSFSSVLTLPKSAPAALQARYSYGVRRQICIALAGPFSESFQECHAEPDATALWLSSVGEQANLKSRTFQGSRSRTMPADASLAKYIPHSTRENIA